MSLLKSEMKIAFLHAQGCDLDDQLEAYTQELYRAQGIVKGFEQAAVVLAKFPALLETDIKNERFNEETAKHVKEYLNRIFNTLQEHAHAHNHAPMRAQGKIEAIKSLIAKTKKEYDAEQTKHAELLEKGEDHKVPQSRITKQRPAESLKKQRTKRKTTKKKVTKRGANS